MFPPMLLDAAIPLPASLLRRTGDMLGRRA
jgi:hypothetical protein